MAGDWIKIETGLPAKPEVMQLASILGIDEMQVVGHLVCFWSWCDLNLSQDCPVITGTRSGLDRVAGRDGFVTALIKVGWLITNQGAGAETYTVPHFDYHMSKSAKTRAEERNRKQRQRKVSRKCPADSGTKTGLEERREEKSIKKEEGTPPATLPALAPKSDPVPYSEILSDFNETFGLNCRWTPKRRQQAQQRWRDPDWRDHWQEALERAGPSLFLRGGSDRGWVIDLEFFLRPDTVTKILEGKYDNRQSTNAASNSAAAREQRNADAFAIVFGEGDS